MITFKEKVKRDIKSFDLKITRARKYIRKQVPKERVLLSKKINSIEHDLNDLKKSLGSYFPPADKTRDYLEPDTKQYYERVIEGFKKIDNQMSISIWRETLPIKEIIKKGYLMVKSKLKSAVSG